MSSFCVAAAVPVAGADVLVAGRDAAEVFSVLSVQADSASVAAIRVAGISLVVRVMVAERLSG
ncbi:hypothetical protein ES5_13973 [Dietzia cinnamea P4]|nr:hypothetical protein ES5_13973 [Dietzia cinnamea P4]